MQFKAMTKKLRTLASRVKGEIVKDVPPELYACEVCGRLDCRSEVWLNCRQRLAAAQFMKCGDRQALAELKRLSMERDHELCLKKLTGTGPPVQQEPRRDEKSPQVPT